MEHSNNISVPKLVRRSTPEQFPVYMKAHSKAIYKLLSPTSYVRVTMNDGAVDIQVREYEKMDTCHMYDEYISGTPEYKLSDANEFEKLLLNANEAVLAYARQGVVT